MTSIWRTTAVRFAFVYTGLFCVALGVGLGLVYVSTVGVVERRTDETINSEILALSERFRDGGLRGLIAAVELRTGPDARGDNVYLVATSTGRAVAGNLSRWPREANFEDWIAFGVTKRDGPEVTDRRVRARAFELPGGYRLLVGRDSEDLQQFRQRFLGTSAWAGAVTVVMGLLGGLFLGRRVLHRVAETAAAGERIAAGNLDSRVPVRGRGDEFDRLASSVNAMLDRIEGLMAGMRIATDSISHDVRRPLTRLRANLDLALRADPDPAKARQAMGEAIEEIDTTVAILENLLRIARAEAAVPGEGWAALDLASIAAGGTDLYQPLAEERGIQLQTGFAVAPVEGEAQLLAQAVTNLLDNALKHAPAGTGVIRVSTAIDGGQSVLTVADNGPGIAEADRARVTERFVRLDTARAGDGSGLGLSLVRAVARMHGGTLELGDARPGLLARIALPVRP